jgi:hypothetical protein
MTSHHSALALALSESHFPNIHEAFDFLLREYIAHDAPASALGRLIATYQQQQDIAERSDPACDYLALHRLSEFPAYTSAPTHRGDEPLFSLHHAKLHRAKKRELQQSRIRDKYLDGFGTWCGPERNREAKIQGTDKVTYVAYGHSGDPACLRPVAPRFNQVTPEDVDWATREWKHVAGIASSRFTTQTNWCPTCNEYVVEEHDGPNGISCEDYCRLRELGEQTKRANEAWELEARNQRAKANNNRKCAARGWVGYSVDDARDLRIIEARMQEAEVMGQDVVELTEFDEQLWNGAKKVPHSVTPKEKPCQQHSRY